MASTSFLPNTNGVGPSAQDVLAAVQEDRFIIEDFRPLADSIEWKLGQQYMRVRGSKAFISDASQVPLSSTMTVCFPVRRRRCFSAAGRGGEKWAVGAAYFRSGGGGRRRPVRPVFPGRFQKAVLGKWQGLLPPFATWPATAPSACWPTLAGAAYLPITRAMSMSAWWTPSSRRRSYWATLLCRPGRRCFARCSSITCWTACRRPT